MRNLKAVIHVSTAYSNCHLKAIDEKFYRYHLGYQDLDNIIEKWNEEALDEITPK
jgi:fatty acyl-CoA reductase